MAAQITITPESLRGKRVYLLFFLDNDQEIATDALVADEMPTGTEIEIYCPVPHQVFAGIWANRNKAVLHFGDDGKLISIV